MFRRYWLPLIAVVGLVLTAGSQAQTVKQGGGTASRGQAAQQHVAQSPKPETPSTTDKLIERAAKALETANSDPYAAQEAQDSKTNLKIQRDMELSAWKMTVIGAIEAFITCVGVGLVGWTLHHTRRAANAAEATVKSMEDTSRRQLRAYVGVENIYLEAPNVFSESYVIPQEPLPPGFVYQDNIRIKIKNSGQTPASKVSAFVSYYTFPFGAGVAKGAQLPTLLTQEQVDNASRAILDGESAFNFTINIRKSLDPFRRAINKETSLLFDGHIEYMDVFGDAWNRRFRFMWEPWRAPDDRLVFGKEGNFETLVSKSQQQPK